MYAVTAQEVAIAKGLPYVDLYSIIMGQKNWDVRNTLCFFVCLLIVENSYAKFANSNGHWRISSDGHKLILAGNEPAHDAVSRHTMSCYH